MNYDPFGQYIVACYQNGAIKLHSSKSGEAVYNFKNGALDGSQQATSARWLDNDSVVTTNTKGQVQVWHAMLGTPETTIQVSEATAQC